MNRLIVALLFALYYSVALPTRAEWVALVMPHYGVELIDTTDPAKWIKTTPDEVFTTHGITFHLDFMDPEGSGFRDGAFGEARRERLKDVLGYIAETLDMSGELDMKVNVSENNPSGPLAFAGSVYPLLPGFQDASSFVRLNTGVKPYAGVPEIELTVNFYYNWHLGTEEPPPTKVDFFSVMLHEMTHGLGFTTLSTNTGASMTVPGCYTRFDQFMVRRSEARYLFEGEPPAFAGTTSDLVSNDLGFNGDTAFTYYGQGIVPPLYAPNPFLKGSSLQHWNTGNIVGGAVMEHLFAPGVVKRRYAPLDVGALVDLGYTNATVIDLPWCALQPVAITQPTGNFTVPSGQQATIALRASVSFDHSVDCRESDVLMTYYVNTQKAGESIDRAGGFPVSIQRGAGTYNLVAEAEVVETGETMTASKSFSVTELPPPALEVTPSPGASLVFPDVVAGGASDRTVTVQNTGGTAVSGTATVGAGPFAFSDGAKIKSFTLNPGASVSLTVRFSPTRKALENSTLTITGDPSGAITLALRGNGIQTGAFSCGGGGGASGAGDGLLAAMLFCTLLYAARRRTIPTIQMKQ